MIRLSLNNKKYLKINKIQDVMSHYQKKNCKKIVLVIIIFGGLNVLSPKKK
jgi:hypothetical protein